MRKKISAINLNWWVVVFLILGVLFKLYVTSGGMFLFHIDSARDYVDVREMVELRKPRLIGQTSGVEGFYNGPGWYYLLAVAYILADGSPYGGVVMMIVLWAIGGYFLYLITKKYGAAASFSALLLWFASPYISLATVYSFNPHPLLFLTPVFVYVLERFIKSGSVWYGISTAVLAALFFQWEMNTGVFMPIIILLAIVLAAQFNLFKSKAFWISIGVYLCSFLPQLFFDFKHDFIMSQAVMRFLGEGGAGDVLFSEKFYRTWDVFINAFNPTLVNNPLMVKAVLILFLLASIVGVVFKQKRILQDIDVTFTILLLMIVIPFVGYILLPVNVYSWHMVSVIVAFIGLIAFLIRLLQKSFPIGWGMIGFFLLFCLVSSWQVIGNGFAEHGKGSVDPSTFVNELKAIDYAYEKTGGQNFKAYSYLPSVIDFPYQYLYWWYGLKKYGYTPIDYAYLPNMPEYISNKAKFNAPKEGVSDSELIVLIKDLDKQKRRHLWENSFSQYPLVERQMVGPLEVEIRISTDSAMINSAP